jgi:proteic killer suppression protein
VIRRIRHRHLKRLYERGDASGFAAHDIKRLRQILSRLDAASRPEEMDLPGLHFHRLRGDRKDTFAVTVRANFRVTWRVDADGAFIDVDHEDYH